MPAKQMEDLFHETLKDVYFTERQLLKALPKIAKAATSKELRTALLEHRDQTEGHVERLGQVFEMIGKPARGKTCEAIKGLLEEGEGVIEDFDGSEALDDGVIAACQAVEHYEIARYGALSSWATRLGLSEASSLLEQTLAEEKEADQLLSEIAEKGNGPGSEAETRPRKKAAAKKPARR